MSCAPIRPVVAPRELRFSSKVGRSLPRFTIGTRLSQERRTRVRLLSPNIARPRSCPLANNSGWIGPETFSSRFARSGLAGAVSPLNYRLRSTAADRSVRSTLRQSQTAVGSWEGHDPPWQLESFDRLQRLIRIGVDDNYIVRSAAG